jgi:multidrug resistance efflux pump
VGDFLTLAELDEKIAAVEDNLRQLVEQAAAYSVAADEERASSRIDDQQSELDRLMQLREAFSG